MHEFLQRKIANPTETPAAPLKAEDFHGTVDKIG
jgi:hypothetical protein